MLLREESIDVSDYLDLARPLQSISELITRRCTGLVAPVRLALCEENDRMVLELGVVHGADVAPGSLCSFRKRVLENTGTFNAVMIIPTGVGAELGGHAGDACPAARLLAEACDTLVLHPNVVNASDLNELPVNSLYVEGSVLTRLMMGTVGLSPVRSNRILVVLGSHGDEVFLDSAVNAVNAVRGSVGVDVVEVLVTDPPVRLIAHHTETGRAAGRVQNLEVIHDALESRKGSFDAVAFSSVIEVPKSFHLEYFASGGEMVNPWGGVEAMFTHAVSAMYDIPSAHSPMFESDKIANLRVGVVDPRMAAEAVSLTFLNCILKGLHRSPRLVTEKEAMARHGVLSAEHVSVLVQPDGCLGLPTMAALDQGIRVIAVKENRTIMANDLEQLPWQDGQFWKVENYWEAAGLMLAMRGGVEPLSTRRPFVGVRSGYVGPLFRDEVPSEDAVTDRDMTVPVTRL